jgi:hypothetical protein
MSNLQLDELERRLEGVGAVKLWAAERCTLLHTFLVDAHERQRALALRGFEAQATVANAERRAAELSRQVLHRISWCRNLVLKLVLCRLQTVCHRSRVRRRELTLRSLCVLVQKPRVRCGATALDLALAHDAAQRRALN